MSPPHKEYKPHPELQKHIDFQKEGMYVPDQPVVGFSPPSTHFWLQARGIEIIEDDDDDDFALHFDEIDAAAAEVGSTLCCPTAPLAKRSPVTAVPILYCALPPRQPEWSGHLWCMRRTDT